MRTPGDGTVTKPLMGPDRRNEQSAAIDGEECAARLGMGVAKTHEYEGEVSL